MSKGIFDTHTVMKVLIVDNYTKNLEELKNLLNNFDFSVIKKKQFSIKIAHNFDLIVFSGGSGVRSVKNHKEEYKTEIDFIKKTDKKVIGICLGCEIIAVAFDCSLKKLKLPEKKITKIKMSKMPFDTKKEILVYESHCFIIDKVSEDIEILATSDDGIEFFKHKNKPIYGLQFHPEKFVDKTQGKKIFLEILKNVKGHL